VSTLFAFLHHVAAFTLVSALAVEFVLIRQDLTLSIARRLPNVDAVLGLSAGFLLVIGLLRVFFFEKGAAYYFHSHAFMTKFSVFIAVALLSIIPTMEFLSWRKPVKAGELPVVSERKLRFIRSIIHGEWAPLSSSCFAPRSWRGAAGFRQRPSRQNRPMSLSVRRY